MARNFRSSRFRGGRDIGEDVNPSAYIVNLADCMLVLACGFLVAMISFWQIDLSPNMTKLEGEQLEQIDPEVLPQDITRRLPPRKGTEEKSFTRPTSPVRAQRTPQQAQRAVPGTWTIRTGQGSARLVR